MGAKTGISWCHHTFSPWRSCTHAKAPSGLKHPGCLNCYAELLVTRKAMGGVKGEWGSGAPRVVAAKSGWQEAYRWARLAAEAGERRRVFPSLCDPLDEEAPPEAQVRYWQLIRDTAFQCSAERDDVYNCRNPVPGMDAGECASCGRPAGGLDHLVLTKRPWRAHLIPEDVRPLIWLGTSVSDQPTADEWLSALLAQPGFRLYFCSYEPALGAVDFRPWLSGWTGRGSGLPAPLASALESLPDLRHLSWLIAGGESGENAKRRPCEVAWFQSAADQCAATGTAFYMKQDGAFRAGQQGRIPDALWARKEVPA